MIVSAASRIVSAISLGVFCRCAPSTSAIMRSTKDSPGAAVICTTIRSDSTVVPPVTELRSPPDSRITGADSPVMADSSTVAMPSTMSPSPGITCPASTTTRSPTFSVGAGDLLLGLPSGTQPAGHGLGAGPAQAVGLGLAAALGDGLGEVGEQDGEPQPDRDQPGEDARVDDGQPVTRTEPTQTTNMTGLRSWVRGSSLRSASGSERQSWRAENAPAPMVRPVRSACRCWRSTIDRSRVGGGHARASAIGPRASAGKKVRAATRTTVPQTRTPNSAPCGGQGAGAGFDALLRGERPGEREHGQDRHEAAEQHRQAEGGLEERAGHGEPGEGAAVVVGRRGVGVEHLGQPVRAGVRQCGVELARLAPARRRRRAARGSAWPGSRSPPRSPRCGRASCPGTPGSARPSARPGTPRSRRARGSRTARRRPRPARPRRAGCSAG